jgi:ribosomal protein L19E
MESGRKTRFRSELPLALWRRRTSREPSREDATREEIDGADSQDEPKIMKEATSEQRLRASSGRVRKTFERSRKGPVRGALNEPGSATARAGRP